VSGLAAGHWGGDAGPISAAQDRGAIGAGEELTKRKKGAAAKTVPFLLTVFHDFFQKTFVEFEFLIGLCDASAEFSWLTTHKMRLDNVLKQEEFDGLLGLFSEDREEAGVIYEEMRNSLVRFFESRDCRDADMLADETLFRVASKAHTFDPTRHTRTSSFIFGFASKILLEYSRDPQKLRITYDRWVQSALTEPAKDNDTDEEAEGMECLRKCLGEMSVEDRDLMITYYGKEKQEKIASRKLMAERLGIKMETLHMRVHRLRESLKKCMKRCRSSELR